MQIKTLATLLLCLSAGQVLANDAGDNFLERNQAEQLTQEDQEARRIIRLSDRVRSPDAPYRSTLTLLEHKDGKALMDREQVLDVSMRFYKPSERRDKGDARALVRFLSPVRDKGKGLLSDFYKMWYYSPDLRRPIPIAKQQRLMGQVANGDVVAADFDYSYLSKLQGEEACGDKQCYKLSLERRWPYVTYPAITFWVEKETYRPYRADFLSSTGLLIKRAYYKDYRPALGGARPHQMVIEDALRKDVYTTITYSNFTFESLPESYFQKEYLMRME